MNPATTAGAFVRFSDNSILRGKRIVGIEAFDAKQLVNTPDQVPCIAQADIPTATLVLKEASSDRVDDCPLFTLQVSNTAGIWKEFRPFVGDWQKSGVRFVANPAATLFTVPFNVYYLPEGE